MVRLLKWFAFLSTALVPAAYASEAELHIPELDTYL